MPLGLSKTQLPPTTVPASKQSNGTAPGSSALAAAMPDEPAPDDAGAGSDGSGSMRDVTAGARWDCFTL
jgi:hypothetical protein